MEGTAAISLTLYYLQYPYILLPNVVILKGFFFIKTVYLKISKKFYDVL